MIADFVPTSIRTPRGNLEYVDTGEGPAVLALHGVMGGWDQSMILARTVGAPACRTLALSRPGYLGTPLEGARSPEEQADLYTDLLDTLGIPQVAVLAISGGGPSALHFALRHPGRCWGLVLVSTVAGPLAGRLPLSFHIITALARWPGFATRLRRRLERDPEAAARRSIRDPEARARMLADPEVSTLYRALRSSIADRIAMRLPGTKNDLVATRRRNYPLEEIRVPTLVVHGTKDRVVPFEQHGAVLARRIPGAEFLSINDGEHVSLFTHRGEIQARVARFLRDHAPADLPKHSKESRR